MTLCVGGEGLHLRFHRLDHLLTVDPERLTQRLVLLNLLLQTCSGDVFALLFNLVFVVGIPVCRIVLFVGGDLK